MTRTSAPVSVLISTFNRSDYIGEALDGILGQSRPPRQIIVMDDGSSDETATVLEKYGNRIEHHRQDNAGKSAALNRIVPLAKEDFIWIFDDDDVPQPDALERHLEVLGRHPGADFTYSAGIRFTVGKDGRKTFRNTFDCSHVTSPEDVLQELLRCNFFHQQGSLVRTEAFRNAGPYREDLTRSLDYDFGLRLARRAEGRLVDKPTYLYRVHEGTRGTADGPVNARNKGRNWYEYDKLIFQTLHDSLELWEYLPHAPKAPPPAFFDETAALLARVGVMGRKGLWQHAIADLERLLAEGKLDAVPVEQRQHYLNVMVSQPFALEELFHDSALRGELCRILQRIREPAVRSGCGKSILYQALLHRSYGDQSLAMHLFYLAAAIAGMAGVQHAVLQKVRGR